MTRIEQMYKTHPTQSEMDSGMMADCLESCMECLETCNSCADACLGEKNVDMLKRCIRLNLDCADLCEVSARILSRQTETDWRLVRSVTDTMAMACRLCAEECEKHAKMHDHCRVCAEACRRCEQSCHKMMGAIPVAA